MRDEPPIATGVTGILGKFFNDLPAGIHLSVRVLLDALAGIEETVLSYSGI